MSYGETVALRGISFSVQAGEVVGLLGPNGAGKTTAMKILVGYLLPAEGRVVVAGHDVIREPLEAQRRIGYLPENAPLYSDMLVQEYLGFMADMRDLDGNIRRARLTEAIEECAIGEVLTRPIGHLSKGFRQRVGVASALLHDPDILILDEPTSGLDPNQIVEVRDLIRKMGRTKTVILSTHILPEVEATCGRAVILIDGQVRADGSLEELTHSRVQLLTATAPDPGRACELLKQVPGVATVDLRETGDASAGAAAGPDRFYTFRLHLEDDRDVGVPAAEIARQEGWQLRELRRDDKSLEAVFRELTETAAEVTA
jgi:ABC-2 type transport system ATP-binding protein